MLPQLGSLTDLSNEEKIIRLEAYIRQLEQQLSWQLQNLDETNFTDDFLNSYGGN